MNVSNESLLLSFFNQYLFNEAKQNIEHIEYFYQTNPSTSGNPLVGELIKAIKDYNLDAIGEPLFRSILMRCQKTPTEANQIMSEVLKWKKFSREEIAPAAKDMRDVISTAIINKASARFGNSSTDFLKYLKNVNVSLSDAEVFSSTSFDKIDIDSIIADAATNGYQTNVDLINRAFPDNIISGGQIFCISASPGSGKTLFSMNLALWFASQKKKTLFVSLADTNWRDAIIRLGSIAFGITFAEASRNLKSVYENLTKITGDYLELSINSAGTVTADQIIEKVLADDIKILMVDYDGVIGGISAEDGLYNSFGDVYNKFTQLTSGNNPGNSSRLIFIMSQPKVNSWTSGQNGGLISLGDLSESSKKAQIVDNVLCISRINSYDCPHPLYDIRYQKCRRGNPNTRGYFYRNQARFVEIPKGLAEQLKMETEEREYTDQQIQAMAERYKQSEKMVQQAVKQEQQKRYDNPFT